VIYECYRDGRRIDRVQPVQGDYDDTRIGVAVIERRESEARDGWYVDGEWQRAEAERQAAVAEPAEPKTTRPRTSRPAAATTED
jgi:hypothetical protein